MRHGYDQTGTAIWSGNNINPNAYVSSTRSTNTNYAAPDMITTGNSLNTSMSWNQSLQSTGTTGPNSDNTTILYDSTSRPSQKISPYGAYTNYSYSVTAPQITQSINGRTVKTYLDGFGRTAHDDKSDSNTTQSIVESAYDSCGCSPMGKLSKRSMPHASGATAVWTTYTYDSLGRLLTMVRPDGQSTSTYSYAGNTGGTNEDERRGQPDLSSWPTIQTARALKRVREVCSGQRLSSRKCRENARCVLPELPYHITQRGTNHQCVFFTAADRTAYLRLLQENLAHTETRTLAWCLMTNHVHLVLVPGQPDSLEVLLRRDTAATPRWSIPGGCAAATCGRTGTSPARFPKAICAAP